MYRSLDRLFGSKGWGIFLIVFRILTVALLAHVLWTGLNLRVPNINILNNSIRNVIYHVPLWIAMNTVFLGSFVLSIAYLIKPEKRIDMAVDACVQIGVLFGVLGFLTGMVWAKVTWGMYIVPDIKVIGSFITLLIYLAYKVLRNAIDEPTKRARVAAVYNIMAFTAMIVLIWILPRVQDSLHPGNGGNPLFKSYDMDGSIRPVFRLSLLAFSFLACWLSNIRYRMIKVEDHFKSKMFEK